MYLQLSKKDYIFMYRKRDENVKKSEASFLPHKELMA